MAFFSADQIALLRATEVRIALLAEFHFATVMRYWNGDHELTAGGNTWNGLHGLARVEGLTESRGTESRQVTFTLSHNVPELNALAIGDPDAVQGKTAVCYFQLFNRDWVTVGAPIPIYFGICQPMTVSRQSAEIGEAIVRTIRLPTENLFYGRSRVPAGLYTHADQQARAAGDQFFVFTPLLKNLRYSWL